MNLRQINLRQMAALLGTTAGIVREAERMLDRIERKQRSAAPRTLIVLALAGVGVVALTVAASPDMRRKLRDAIRDWLGGTEAQPVAASPRDATPVGEAPSVDADLPGPYVDGARP